VTFNYDPFGRRIEKVSPTATSIFAYDGDNLVETVNSSGGLVARYTQGEDIDEPLAMLRGSTTSFYDADGLGSITSLSNAGGALAQTYTYDSFGNTTNSSGSLTNFFQYTGREYDTETNLYFYRARYYDSSSGRFLAEDPLDFDGDGTNFYDYALNNPNVFVDPFGLWHCVADADCNFTPEFKKGLDRFQECIGKTEIIITSGRRPPTPSRPNTGHTRGEACDIGRNSNPNLPRDKVVSCFLQSFPNSYGQEEKNGNGIPGTHFHFQQNPLPGTQPGFPPGVRPYQP
jgi:RHS repeat-associated protein